MRRRGLGSSQAVHTAEGSKLSREIDNHAAALTNAARNGRCTAAQIEYARMHNAVGQLEAHMKSGGKVWKPTTAIQEGSYEFTTHCVRDSKPLSGSRKRRR